MLIKKADDPTRALAQLETLARSGHPARGLSAVYELRQARAALRAEAAMIGLIDRHFGKRPDLAVLHDLRLDETGDEAEIDHVLIHASLHIFVLTTRDVRTGMKITDRGEFLRRNEGGRGFVAMASPLAQNERNAAVLRDVLAPLLPLRLDGADWAPVWHSLVVVPDGAKIDRPPHFDTRQVIKADLLPDAIATALRGAEPVLTPEQTVDLGRRLAVWHRPLPQDYRRRFRIFGEAGRSASPDSPADWKLEPLVGEEGAGRRGFSKARWMLLALALLAALAAGWAALERFGGGWPRQQPAPVAPPVPVPAVETPPPPAVKPAKPKPKPKPRKPRAEHPPARAPAAETGPLVPEALPEPQTLAPETAPLPEAPEPASAPAPPPPLERPEVEMNDYSLRATTGEGQPVAEILGNLPRIREEMRRSRLGLGPANASRPASPECKPGAVMTDAEIEACRQLARQRR